MSRLASAAGCRDGQIWDGEQCRELRTLTEACGGDDFCQELVAEKYSLLQGYRQASWTPDHEGSERDGVTADAILPWEMEAAVFRSIYASTWVARQYLGTKTKFCRVSDLGGIHCARVAALAAFYESSVASQLIEDMQVIEAVSPSVSELDNTLIDCGRRGAWGSVRLDDDDVVSLEEETQISEACGLAGSAALQEAREEVVEVGTSTPYDFGHAVGLSRLSSIGMCGLDDLSEPTSADSFIEATLASAEAMRQDCDRVTAAVGIHENFLMAGSTITDGNGSVTEISADGTQIVTTSTDANDVQTIEVTLIGDHGDVTHDVQVVDSAGNLISDIHIQARGDGTVDVNGTSYASDGEVLSSYELHFQVDGSGAGTITNADGESVDYVWASDGAAEGSDGSRRYMDRRHGSVSDIPVLPLEPIPSGRSGLPGRRPNDVCDSLDTCRQCRSFDANYEKVRSACLAGAGSRVCQAFGAAVQCCSGEGSSPLVIPNPMGDFQCAGMADEVDMVAVHCQEQCRIVDGDCMQTCMSLHAGGNLRYSLLDAMCLHAISDDCFGDEYQFLDAPIPSLPDLGPVMTSLSLFSEPELSVTPAAMPTRTDGTINVDVSPAVPLLESTDSIGASGREAEASDLWP